MQTILQKQQTIFMRLKIEKASLNLCVKKQDRDGLRIRVEENLFFTRCLYLHKWHRSILLPVQILRAMVSYIIMREMITVRVNPVVQRLGCIDGRWQEILIVPPCKGLIVDGSKSLKLYTGGGEDWLFGT